MDRATAKGGTMGTPEDVAAEKYFTPPDRVEELVESVRLTDEEILIEVSFDATVNPMLLDWLKKVARAQHHKALFNPDFPLALIDRDFLLKIKAMLRGVQIKQQANTTITWETALDVALKEFDNKVIPLVEAMEVKE